MTTETTITKEQIERLNEMKDAADEAQAARRDVAAEVARLTSELRTAQKLSIQLCEERNAARREADALAKALDHIWEVIRFSASIEEYDKHIVKAARCARRAGQVRNET